MNVVDDIQPDFVLFFPSVDHAVRFTAVAHVALMYAEERITSQPGCRAWHSLSPKETSLSGKPTVRAKLSFKLSALPRCETSERERQAAIVLLPWVCVRTYPP
jgi:hypothetical protein